MVKNNSWVAIVAIIALILALVAVIMVLKVGMTGNVTWSQNKWLQNLGNPGNVTYELIDEGETFAFVTKVPRSLAVSNYAFKISANHIKESESGGYAKGTLLIHRWGNELSCDPNYSDHLNCALLVIKVEDDLEIDHREVVQVEVFNKYGMLVATGIGIANQWGDLTVWGVDQFRRTLGGFVASEILTDAD